MGRSLRRTIANTICWAQSFCYGVDTSGSLQKGYCRRNSSDAKKEKIMFARKLSVLVACVSASLCSVSFASQVPAEDTMFAQVFTNWIAVVQDGASAQMCAQEIQEKTGYEVTQTLELLGTLAITTPSSDASKLTEIPCILAYEPEAVAFPL
jgi:hypothetical protein